MTESLEDILAPIRAILAEEVQFTEAEAEFVAMMRLAGVHEWLVEASAKPFGGLISLVSMSGMVEGELAANSIDDWTNLAFKMVRDHPDRFGVIAASFDRIADNEFRRTRFVYSRAIWEANQ